MTTASPAPVTRLIAKLESIADLSAEEKKALLALPMRVQDVGADQDIVCEGDRPSQVCLLLDGFMIRFKLTEKGKRQIFAVHTPGDIPDLQSLHIKTMDHSLGTVTPCTVAFIQHEVMAALTHKHPRLAGILWRETLIDAAIFREWMLGIGRRSAKTRIAHFLCEVFTRLKAVGMVEDDTALMPITQAEVGDSLGLSTVHVNRMLQELRGDDLFTWDGGVFEVLDWERLKRVAEFDSAYLHLDRKVA